MKRTHAANGGTRHEAKPAQRLRYLIECTTALEIALALLLQALIRTGHNDAIEHFARALDRTLTRERALTAGMRANLRKLRESLEQSRRTH